MKKKLHTLYNIYRRQQKVVGSPIHIQVETTNACNLCCATCHRDLLYPKPTVMKFENFKKIYDAVQPENINVSGLGEPFLNPEIFEIIKYAKINGSAVNCASNFTLVGDKIEQILDSGIDQIKISVDAVDRETYYRIRHGDFYDTLINNIKRLNSLKAERGLRKPILRFNYALQQDNIDQLVDAVKLAHKLSVPGIYVQYLEYIDREDRKEKLVGNITYAKLKNTLLEADNVATKLGITSNINIWMRDFDLFMNKMGHENNFKPNDKKCYFPWFSSWIDADGTVRPCPIIPWQKDVAHMGNAFNEPFKDIWNNIKYQELRAALARGERPTEPCRTCIPQSLFNIFQIGTKLLPK